MADMNPVIEVRRAGLDDFQAVMDINKNAYNGLDYIPIQYEALVTDPMSSFYVCLVDGEVGAFQGVSIQDEGNALIVRAVRVKKKFQGQGLTAHIRKKIYEDFKDMPGEKKIRCSCTNLVRFVQSKTFRCQNETLLVERIVQFEAVDVKQMTPVACDLEDAKPITLDEFSHLLDSDSIKNYLFPHNLFKGLVQFYDALPSNVKHLKQTSSFVIITKTLYEFLPSSTTQIMDDSDDNNICEIKAEYDGMITGSSSNKGDNREIIDCIARGLLGLGSYYFTPTYLLLWTNIYGRPAKGKEVDEIRSILKHSYSFLHELYQDKSKYQTAITVVDVSKEIPEEFVLEASKPFGLTKSTWDPVDTEIYYFEQEFQCLLK